MSEKKYTKDHEWVSIENEIATIGISNHAQESLGDIVFIELPSVGNSVKAKDEICVVESVKAASDIYAPIDGEIIEINKLQMKLLTSLWKTLKDNGLLLYATCSILNQENCNLIKKFLNTMEKQLLMKLNNK